MDVGMEARVVGVWHLDLFRSRDVGLNVRAGHEIVVGKLLE